MFAFGKFFVNKVDKRVSEQGNEYIKVSITDIEKGKSSFNAFYRGQGIEEQKLYLIEFVIGIYSDGADYEITGFSEIKE